MQAFQVVVQVGMKGLRPLVPSTCSDKWKELMEKCWAENPADRPSFDQIIEYLEEI